MFKIGDFSKLCRVPQISGQVREVYLRPHSDEEDPITEIQFPVVKS
jgi:hypothetical protein